MNELPAIEATYAVIARGLDRQLDLARQGSDQAAVEWIEKQQIINDSAYFILVWGQLEARINEVCAIAIRHRRGSASWETRRSWDAHDPDSMRSRFEDRAALVLDRAANQNTGAYHKTMRYYGQRNRVAHGTSLASGIDVPTVISEVYQITSELCP